MPDVPRLPGVPSLSSYASGVVTLLVSDAVRGLLEWLNPKWGLYKNGIPVVVADSVATFGYKQDWVIADYPLEGGKFESYDKVFVPFNVQLRFASGGSVSVRQKLLSSIEAIAGSLETFDAITPERIYSSVNVMHYDYSRESSRGLGLLVVDVMLQQVRVAAAGAFSNTKSPNGESPVNIGQVQTLPSSAVSGASLGGLQ